MKPAAHLAPARRAVLRGLVGAGALALAHGPLLAQTRDEYGDTGLRGAGSTFVYPLAARWVQEYRRHLIGDTPFARPNGGLDDNMIGVALDYEPVGSSAGIQRLRAGAVDFALSEMPLPAPELRRLGLRQLPLVLGPVAIAANLPGVGTQPLHLNGAVLGEIYLGRVQRWNDPQIQALNPQLTLPDAAIVPLHRSDGSGTTFTLTSYLNGQHPAWQGEVGADALVKWPGGRAVRGSSGMAEALRSTPQALGYVDAVQARQAKLTLIALRNRAGRFVAPDAAGATAAAQAARWDGADGFARLLLDSEGEASYPIVASVYALLPDAPQRARNQRTAAFLDWALVEGRRSAEEMGYLPLPVNALDAVRAVLGTQP